MTNSNEAPSMGWSVELSGDRSDLARLAKSAAVHADFGWTITTNGDAYCVTSPEFDALNDDALIRSRASEILALWNGAARLEYDGGNIGIKFTRFVSPSGRQSVRQAFTFHVRKKDSVEASEATEQCVKYAAKDSALRRVLELDARHGASNDTPPPKPMSLPEASTLIRELVQSWRKAKIAAPGN
jgi:hypothetical protein